MVTFRSGPGIHCAGGLVGQTAGLGLLAAFCSDTEVFGNLLLREKLSKCLVICFYEGESINKANLRFSQTYVPIMYL
jgi:hypothetical protein